MRLSLYVILGSGVLILLAGCRYVRHDGVCEQQNVCEDVTAIRYYEFGAPGDVEDYLEIDIPKNSLLYETGRYLPERWKGCDETPEIEARFSYVCNDAEWRFVVSNLNAMAVSEWKARYDDNDIIDGTSWRLELCDGTNVVREYGGSNAWSERFHCLRSIEGFVRGRPAFVAAYPEIAEKDEFWKWFYTVSRDAYYFDPALPGLLVPPRNVAGRQGQTHKRSIDESAIVDGRLRMRLRFVPVNGTSLLPLEFMHSGKDRNKTEAVTIDQYWIADAMVTEGCFADVMGRSVRDGRNPNQPLSDIEWEDALVFCDKLSQWYAHMVPDGVVVSMPTMIEWAHAVKVLGDKENLDGEIGSFVFTGSQRGGFMATSGTTAKNRPIDFDLATDFSIVPKRARMPNVGLRLVLVRRNGGKVFAGGKQIDNTLVCRGSLLAEFGLFDHARAFVEALLANDKANLSEEDRARASKALEYVNKDQEYNFEDWSGLVARAASFVVNKGFRTEPFVEEWAMQGFAGSNEDAAIAEEYRKVGIVGEWQRIGDLPSDVRKGQSSLGDADYILMHGKEGEESFEYEYTVTESNLVQVLRCDFTGDGLEDMVVENYRSTGSGGYWYSFYEATGNGGYKAIDEVQLVGLCALPRKLGKGCGFLIIDKESNPVLSASLYVFKDGKLSCERAATKPFYMLDAEESRIYMAAPFIGAGYGMGWRLLESRGVWFRPVYWPWKQGEVQDYKEACKKAQALSHPKTSSKARQ